MPPRVSGTTESSRPRKRAAPWRLPFRRPSTHRSSGRDSAFFECRGTLVSVHRARAEWQRNGMPFEPAQYSRAHRIEFESLELAGNAAKENIPPGAPHGPGADPEQLFVASLSACHMLWFVSLAAARKLIVNRYVDDAEGVLEKNSEGRSEEHTSELQSPDHLVCRLLLEKKKELTEVLLLMCFLAHRRSTRGYTTYSS